MEKFESINAALDFAIAREQEAADFYTDLAGKMERPWMAEVFKGFAREENGHKAKLEAVKKGKTLAFTEKKILDLKIAEYVVEVDDQSPHLNYQEALILAMKKEKAAFRLYSDLAESAETEDIKNTFLALAQEEAKHKLRMEVEYDDVILAEN